MMPTRRPRVLVLTPYFLPSQQGGGSVRAVYHLCQQLGRDFELVIAAGDRDVGASLPPEVRQAWQAQSGMDVRYLPYGFALPRLLLSLLRERWDLLYCNSLLSTRFTALPLLINRGKVPVLLAPRGELLAGAFSRRHWLKRAYLGLLRHAGLLRGVSWHATSEAEKARFGEMGLGPVTLAADLPAPLPEKLPPPQPLPEGPLRIVFLSRIDPQKNLAFALEVLARVKHPVQLDVYGPLPDAAYWRRCAQMLSTLPEHVNARYRGSLAPSQVDEVLRQYELFMLPTLGENHGYAIAEALAAGCVLLLSDRTPWNRFRQPPLIQTYSLQRPQEFADAIEQLAELDAAGRLLLRQQTQKLGLTALDLELPSAHHRSMFEAVMQHIDPQRDG